MGGPQPREHLRGGALRGGNGKLRGDSLAAVGLRRDARPCCRDGGVCATVLRRAPLRPHAGADANEQPRAGPDLVQFRL
jgi:hypothetical protein